MKADEVKSVAAREEVKNWFGNTLYTRLNDKSSGRIVSIQQRLHEDDLPAMLLERSYHHLNLPAIAERGGGGADGERACPSPHRRRTPNPAREDKASLTAPGAS
ncbi:hypothetical protein AB5I41_09865 [Sphingomonas sp. MMS24-JH45]